MSERLLAMSITPALPPGDHLSPILQVRTQWKLNLIRPWQSPHRAGLPHVRVRLLFRGRNLQPCTQRARGSPWCSLVKANLKGRPFRFKGEHALSLPFVCQKISYISALAQAVFVPSWIMRRWSRTRPPPSVSRKNAESPIAHRPTKGQSRKVGSTSSL